MIDHLRRTHRAPVRAALVLTSTALLLSVLAGPVAADTPAQWADDPSVSVLQFLVVLVLIPVGIALVLTLLAVAPSLARSRGNDDGEAWRGEGEWAGGPRRGVQAGDDVDRREIESSSSRSGGASGRW